MEDAPDMDDLLDELEADLVAKSRMANTQPQPPLPVTAAQPTEVRTNSGVLKIQKVLPHQNLNSDMAGEIKVNLSTIPKTFKPQAIISKMNFDVAGNEENTMAEPPTPAAAERPPTPIPKFRNKHPIPPKPTEEIGLILDVPPRKPAPKVGAEVKVEVEAEVQAPPKEKEVQIRKEEEEAAAEAEPETISEGELNEIMEYLNGFNDKKAPEDPEDIEDKNAPDSEEDDLIREAAGRVAEDMLEQITDDLEEKLIQVLEKAEIARDEKEPEDTEVSDESGSISRIETDDDEEEEKSLTSEPVTVIERVVEPKIENTPPSEMENGEMMVVEKVESEAVETKSEEDLASEVEPEAKQEAQIDVEAEPGKEDVNEAADVEMKAEESEKVENVDEAKAPENVEESAAPEQMEEEVEEVVKNEGEEQLDDCVEATDLATIETVEMEEENNDIEENYDDEMVENHNAIYNSQIQSIATVHMLNESDSDEPETTRERRLTESELQLGKTCPYWIPDNDCSCCMLCSSKFTVFNRRHHCRACGRVLCGSCCSEKAVLEYLNEPGKKNPPARVCKPCSTMLSRITARKLEYESRRESSADEVLEDNGAVPPPPRGVLKNRQCLVLGEETASSSSTSSSSGPSSSSSGANPSGSGSTPPIVIGGVNGAAMGEVAGSAKRGVVFRDGIRPGAHSEDFDPTTEKSTALKPKKKTRKRTSVVRRCAELRMEDELACALPTSLRNTFLINNRQDEELSFEAKPQEVFDLLRSHGLVTIVLKKNLSCVLQIVEDDLFGFVWAISTNGFSQIGLDELFFSWVMNENEKALLVESKNKMSDDMAMEQIPTSVMHRISAMFASSTENEYAGVRRVESRFSMLHSVPVAVDPLPKHLLLFRPNIQSFKNFQKPMNSFLVVCFLHDNELQWATACPNRLLYRIGLKFGCYPTPIINKVGRDSVYSLETATSVFKVLTDFRSWSYRLKYIPGCTASLTDETTVIRIPTSAAKDLCEIIKSNKNMVSWRTDLSIEDDSLLVCDETSPGCYQTQVFSRRGGKRVSSSVSFLIIDGGSKVSSLQVGVVEDGVSIRVQSDRLENILEALMKEEDVVEKTDGMELRIEFYDDQKFNLTEFTPKSAIDERNLLNKWQYGLSLERALTQVIQLQGTMDYGVRLSHVYNLSNERFSVEEEHKIYGMMELIAKECANMLEPFMKVLIPAGQRSVSVRLIVSPDCIEYDVGTWVGLEDECESYKIGLDQLIPILYSRMDYVLNPFEVEMVLSIVSIRPLPF